MEGTGGTAGPGRGTGGTAGPGRGAGEIGRPGCGARGPRCPWAAGPDNDPTRRSKLAARTAEAGGTDTTASQISHAIPPQHESTQAQKPQNINDQNPKPDMRSRELHAELLVGSHSWASGRCAEPHVSTLSSPAAHPAPPTPKNPRVHKQQPAPHSNTSCPMTPFPYSRTARCLYSPRHTQEFPSRLNRG